MAFSYIYIRRGNLLSPFFFYERSLWKFEMMVDTELLGIYTHTPVHCSSKYYFFCLVTDGIDTESNHSYIYSCRNTVGVRVLGNRFGRGTGPIWLSFIACSGNEMSVFRCTYSGWGVTSCGHSEDVSISCGPDASK